MMVYEWLYDLSYIHKHTHMILDKNFEFKLSTFFNFGRWNKPKSKTLNLGNEPSKGNLGL